MSAYSFIDILEAIDRLTVAVEALDENETSDTLCNVSPVNELVDRFNALLKLPNIPPRELAAIADRRAEVLRVLRRFGNRLYRVIGTRSAIPDPETRLSADEALASNKTADALGVLLRASEWVAKLEDRHSLADDI